MQTETINDSTPPVSLVTSRRFNSYLRSGTLRGRSLALANALEQFKKDENFRDFQGELIEAIMKIRERGKRSPEADRERVLKILAEFPSTVEEIAEDMSITKDEASAVINALLAEGAITQKEQRHWQADGYHYTAFYELAEA